MGQTIRTAVQDRRRFVREGLGMVLRAEPDVDVVGTAADAAALVALCRSTRPDAVILELDVEDWDAPRLAAALGRQQRTLRIIGTYGALTADDARRAAKAGVRAAVAHPSGADGVLAALRARDRHPILTELPVAHRAKPADGNVPSLTPREQDVLALVAAGNTVAEVAELLGISPKTVENRKQRIFTKLGVQNQAHAVAVALRCGILPPHLSMAQG